LQCDRCQTSDEGGPLIELASLAVRRPRTVILLFLLLVLGAAVGALRLREEEDLLVFLPTHDPDVRLFQRVSRTFGALRVALIGVESEDVFAGPTVARLQRATDQIRNVRGVDRVVSMTSLSDVVASAEGAEVMPLVSAPPADAAAARALRDKVLAREHVAGSIVSLDGRATLIMVFLAEGAGDRQVSEAIRQVAEAELRPLTLYYGGAPFAGRAIYEEAQADVWRLSPVALLVLLLVVVLSFRDPVGVVLTVLSVAISALVVLGVMGFGGEKFTVATSTLPVILFASGSSYAVHVLGRYYLLSADGRPPAEAIREALTIVGPPLAIAAATTAVGFFSFVFSDVRPMRAFGIGCGAGVLVCWLVSLTLVPAVVVLWPRRARHAAELGPLGELLVRLWHFAAGHRMLVIGGALAIAAAALGPMSRVEVRMEPRAFFRAGSEPWRAEQFLEERFGGAHFVQVALHGDFNDPATLRELGRLEDYTRTLPGVTQVQSITQPLRLVNDVMGGGLRLPSTAAQAANLYFFLESEAGVRALIDPDRTEALMHVRVRGEPRAVVRALEQFVGTALRRRPSSPSPADVADRIEWVARARGRVPEHVRLEGLLRALTLPDGSEPKWSARRHEVVVGFLASDEAPPLSPELRARLVRLCDQGSPELAPALAAAAPSAEEGALWARNLTTRIADARRQLAVAHALPLVVEAAGLSATPPVVHQLAPIVDDLFSAVSADGHAELRGEVAGEPVLDRGFSRSVGRNLDRSLLISIVVVLGLLYLLFRSLTVASVCMAPSLLTMAVVFGGMGALGVHIDLGTSLVAGIATGAGSDFAMHYMWYLRRQPADEVSRSVGPVMVVSILLVSFGFVVLALGRSPVMRLFGTLAGLSMSLAALFTCLLVPALLNKVRLGDPSARTSTKTEEDSR
jgi:predicted RND superfamily exporter protein